MNTLKIYRNLNYLVLITQRGNTEGEMNDEITVKKLDRMSLIKPTIHFYSHKNKRMLFCESYFEVDCCLFREFDSTIAAYTTQPTTYSYKYYGKTRTYTPDAIVEYTNGNVEFEEVKPPSEAVKPKFVTKFEFLQELHNTVIKIPLILNTGKFVSPIQKVNYEQLYNCLALPFDADYWRECYDYLPTTISLFDLKELLKKSNIDEFIAFQLIAKNIYLTDLSQKLSLNSILEKSHAKLS